MLKIYSHAQLKCAAKRTSSWFGSGDPTGPRDSVQRCKTNKQMALSRRKELFCVVAVEKKIENTALSEIWSASYKHIKKTTWNILPLKTDLLKYKEKFLDYVRMTPDKYKTLLDLCAAGLEKMYTNFRQAISADERLLLALR
ncbi:hypothetical protein PoB_000324500 [Plakobranchus ocellatus]|uniref:Uncharacterized protein n=1 Tax=Plakobranchus ocellatus TaxID=259542 RepID=A0AAV3Y1F0_9GAST|nr:hypothetical protein PoB_000324500 [Plakobranchus ocellatus]